MYLLTDFVGCLFYELDPFNIVARAHIPFADIKDLLVEAQRCRCTLTAYNRAPEPIIMFTLTNGRRFVTADLSPQADAVRKSRLS